jgi:hypothetical protein
MALPRSTGVARDTSADIELDGPFISGETIAGVETILTLGILAHLK